MPLELTCHWNFCCNWNLVTIGTFVATGNVVANNEVCFKNEETTKTFYQKRGHENKLLEPREQVSWLKIASQFHIQLLSSPCRPCFSLTAILSKVCTALAQAKKGNNYFEEEGVEKGRQSKGKFLRLEATLPTKL